MEKDVKGAWMNTGMEATWPVDRKKADLNSHLKRRDRIPNRSSSVDTLMSNCKQRAHASLQNRGTIPTQCLIEARESEGTGRLLNSHSLTKATSALGDRMSLHFDTNKARTQARDL